MESKPVTEVAVVGVGHMGRRHAEHYRDLPGARLVAVVDTEERRAREVSAACRCAGYTDIEELLERHPELQAASVAVPTIHHAGIAEILIRRGVACLIEKPIASTTREAGPLVALAEKAGVVVQVGHIERFNPAVRAVRRLGVQPRLIRSDRVSRTPFRAQDVNVVLDIMIHDLDLALLFTGSGIEGLVVQAHGVSLEDSPEQVANARILFPNGCLAELNASRVALSRKREIRLFNRDSYISIDCERRRAIFIAKADYLAGLQAAKESDEDVETIPDERFRDLVKARDLVTPEEAEQQPLVLELEEFLAAVRGELRPQVDAAAGLRVLALAERVSGAMREAEVASSAPVGLTQTNRSRLGS
jgi:predicted dehydrogenase